jgi:uncharacterized protein YdcH (DUF465 family)
MSQIVSPGSWMSPTEPCDLFPRPLIVEASPVAIWVNRQFMRSKTREMHSIFIRYSLPWRQTNKTNNMPIEKHDLLHELPEHKEAIHELKMNNAHFAKLFEEYHATDKEVHRIEENIETPSDNYTHEQKIKRLALKDALLKLIQEHSQP